MAIDTSALDYRSLTLPKIKTKIKFKKPRKPSFMEAVCLFIVINDTLFGVLDFLKGKYIYSAESTLLAACYWKAYLYFRSSDEEHAWLWIIAAGVLIFTFIFIPGA